MAAQEKYQTVFVMMEQVCKLAFLQLFKYFSFDRLLSSIAYYSPENECQQQIAPPAPIPSIFSNIVCPENSTGNYPDCICEGDLIFNKETNTCGKCPDISKGIYPYCICPKGIYNNFVCNECPANSTGL